MLSSALLSKFGLKQTATTPGFVSELERLITSLYSWNCRSLWPAQRCAFAAQAHAQPQLLHFSPSAQRASSRAEHGPDLGASWEQPGGEQDVSSTQNNIGRGDTQRNRDVKRALFNVFVCDTQRNWVAHQGSDEPQTMRPQLVHQSSTPLTVRPQCADTPVQAAEASPHIWHMPPPPQPPAPIPASHEQHQPTHEQQLYAAYLDLCARHSSQTLPADVPKHYELFKQQLLSELRSGELAAERFLKRQGTRERFGEGQTAVQKHLRPVAVEWMLSLQRTLEDELAKARSALPSPTCSSSPADSKGSMPPPSENTISSQLCVWPILASVGTENVATSVVAGTLQAVLPFLGSHKPWDQSKEVNSWGTQEGECWGVPSTYVAEAVGQRLEELVLHQQLREELLSRMRPVKGKQEYQRGQQRLSKMRHLAQSIEKRTGVGAGLSRQALSALTASISHVEHKRRWSKAFKLQAGAELLHMLIRSSQLHTPEGTVVQGLRYEALPTTKHKELRKLGTIIVHEEVPRLLLQDADRDLLGPTGALLHDSRLMPMLIPPVPWTSFDSGGLVMHGPSAVRASYYKRSMFVQAEKAGQMDQLYRGLNTLNAQPWAINRRVLDVMETLWACLPAHSPKPTPPRASHLDSSTTSSQYVNSSPTKPIASTNQASAQPHHPTLDFPADLLSNLPSAWRAAVGAAAASEALVSSSKQAAAAVPSTPYLRSTRQGVGMGQLVLTAGPLTYNEAREKRRAWAQAKQAASQKSSLASELHLKLQVGRLLAGHERFYIPHNVDFRGRAYPTSCYLHQLGDDTSRGLLLFAEGKPLGQRGLDWLLIQVAKCFGNGKDKMPFEERHRFGKDNLPRILASARTPLQQGEGLWWLEAEEPWQLLATCCEITAALESGDPASFPSRLPLQQDGTCNGLQHYAALARDYSGAFAVNLVPSPIPQDVYTAVSKVVDARVRKDAEQGVSEALKYLSRNGSVDRKLVKQTVMTSVYGVTFVGARQQIEARLEERGWDNKDELYTVSRYLSKTTLSSIGELFRNAEAVMKWLASCAGAVASTGVPVKWQSPLGFPISQPYYETKLAKVDSSLQKFWVLKPSTAVAKRSQRTAFPPNYIHSLDSAHMMMTAMECKARGVAFAGVHDCFWTHAATADDVGAILRDTFVQLHSRPLLEELVEQMKQTAPGITLPPIPPKGHLDLTMVQESPYFFS